MKLATGTLRIRILAAALFVILVTVAAFSQAGPRGGAKLSKEQMAANFRQMSVDFETKGLAEPFKGITTNGEVEPGLFRDPLHRRFDRARAQGGRSAPGRLTPEQRAKTMFAVDDPEWRKWMNQHFYVRQGVSFQEMTDAQRELGFGLLRASLSARGLKLTRDIMRLNETLAELTNDHEFLGEWRYYITVMGKPSATEPWGWQLDGHHAIINYFVLGDQVVMTPFFAGSEPVRAASGKYKGTVDSAGRAEPGPRHAARAHRRPAQEGHSQVLEDRQQQSDRSVQGQRRARLRRRCASGLLAASSASSCSI